jgi:RNA ligase (TIGR02306 family)
MEPKVTYQRDISHCQPSDVIQTVTIKEVNPANNSDNLDLITFNEIGWEVLAQRGTKRKGDRVMFIPPESVLPFELSEKLEVTKYLSTGRVRVTKLRGNRSEGLIADESIVNPYIPSIMKWEGKPTIHMKGQRLSRKESHPDFERFYKIPNILNSPNLLRTGDKIYVSEKIHGTNVRFGLMKNLFWLTTIKRIINFLEKFLEKFISKHQLYVGSHNVILKDSKENRKGNLYWRTLLEWEMTKNLPDGYIFFGEIYGKGVQHLHYDQERPLISLFAAMKNGQYLPVPEFIELCERHNLRHVHFTEMLYEDLEQIRELANSPSTMTKSHMREGVVITKADNPNRMLKCLGFNYLESGGRTERK